MQPKNISFRQSDKGEFEIKVGDLQKAVKLPTPDTLLYNPVGAMGYTGKLSM
jgi:hypothetical protein